MEKENCDSSPHLKAGAPSQQNGGDGLILRLGYDSPAFLIALKTGKQSETLLTVNSRESFTRVLQRGGPPLPCRRFSSSSYFRAFQALPILFPLDWISPHWLTEKRKTCFYLSRFRLVHRYGLLMMRPFVAGIAMVPTFRPVFPQAGRITMSGLPNMTVSSL